MLSILSAVGQRRKAALSIRRIKARLRRGGTASMASARQPLAVWHGDGAPHVQDSLG